MLRTIFYLLFISTFSFGIDIKLLPSNNLNATLNEINVLKDKYQNLRVIIKNEDAKKEIEGYRVLANKFLENNKQINKKLFANIKLETERLLAYEFIKQYQANLKISDEILLSYYQTHKDKFVFDTNLDIIILRTKDYKKAILMYEDFKANKIKDVIQYAKKNSIDIEIKTSKLREMNKIYQIMLQKEQKKDNIMFPPRFYQDHYTLVYIKKYTPLYYKSFEQAKSDIEKELKIKKIEDLKKELIAKYSRE